MIIKPEISISIKQAPLGAVMDQQFMDAADKLIALHEAAPDMQIALEMMLILTARAGLHVIPPHAAEMVARQALAKARGEG